MSSITHNIPHIECVVDEHFLTNFEVPRDTNWLPCVIHSCTTIPGQALLFNILLRNGAMFNRLPIWAFQKEDDGIPIWAPEETRGSQAWEVPSTEASVFVIDLVRGSRIEHAYEGQIDGPKPGTYLFTVDYAGSHEAESAGDFGVKQMHVCELDNGLYVAAPNSRLAFIQPAFTEKVWTRSEEKPRLKSQTKIWRAER